MATYKPNDQYVELQAEARLYCEAFVGSVRLAASRSTISWFQVFGDGQEQKIDAEQEIITRCDAIHNNNNHFLLLPGQLSQYISHHGIKLKMVFETIF